MSAPLSREEDNATDGKQCGDGLRVGRTPPASDSEGSSGRRGTGAQRGPELGPYPPLQGWIRWPLRSRPILLPDSRSEAGVANADLVVRENSQFLVTSEVPTEA